MRATRQRSFVRSESRAMSASLLVGLALLMPVDASTQTLARDSADLQVQVWAASCMACHGPEGRAEGTGLTIGGRPEQELLGKLLGYKSGKLPATIMHQHVKGYSDRELSRIAGYFASLK